MAFPSSKTTDEAIIRRSNHAKNFAATIFKKPITRQKDLDDFSEKYLSPGYVARLPYETERQNTFSTTEMVFPIRHFEVGLRLPLWTEFCQILRHFGIVPAQINPNGVAMIVGFLCFLREEKIAFDLAVFRRVFHFAVTGEGVAYLCSHVCTLVGTANKNHRWGEKLVVIAGDFGIIPSSPIQPPESSFIPPYLEASREKLLDCFRNRRLDVEFWRRRVDVLAEVFPGEAIRALPTTILPSAKVAAPSQGVAGASVREDGGSSPIDLSPGDHEPAAAVEKAKLARKRKGKAPAEGPARKKKEVAKRDLKAKADPAEAGEPSSHPLFNEGTRGEDAYGRPLVTWAENAHEVTLSSNLPAWSEDWEDDGEAYDVMFALYGRADAEVLHDASVEYLAHQSSRAYMRAAELGHATSRRLFDYERMVKMQGKKMIEMGLELAKWREHEAAEIEMAKKISQLEKELEDTRQLLEATQVRNAELETRPAEQQPPVAGPSRVGKQIRMHGDDMPYIRREIARATGKVVLSQLKLGGHLKPEAMQLTVMDIIPALLAEESTSPIRELSSSSGDDDDSDSEEDDDYVAGEDGDAGDDGA